MQPSSPLLGRELLLERTRSKQASNLPNLSPFDGWGVVVQHPGFPDRPFTDLTSTYNPVLGGGAATGYLLNNVSGGPKTPTFEFPNWDFGGGDGPGADDGPGGGDGGTGPGGGGGEGGGDPPFGGGGGGGPGDEPIYPGSSTSDSSGTIDSGDYGTSTSSSGGTTPVMLMPVATETQISKLVISLDHSRGTDRVTRFLEGNPLGLTTADVFNGVDGKKVNPPEWFKVGNGAWGCYMSHLRIIEQAISDGFADNPDSELWVFEEDCCFAPTFDKMYEEFRASVPDDWDQLYLGGQHLWTPKDPDSFPKKVGRTQILRCHNVNRTHAYILRGKFLREMYQHLMDFPTVSLMHQQSKKHHVDHRMGAICARKNVYAPYDWMCGQDEGVSYIRGKVKKRNWWNGHGWER